MTKSKRINIEQFKDWLEKQGAICRIGKGRLEGVIDIGHIERDHFAALYAIPSPSGVQIFELAAYFPSKLVAWQAVQDENTPTHPGALCADWMREQYLTNKNARVVKLRL